jgi:hypothetical protein
MVNRYVVSSAKPRLMMCLFHHCVMHLRNQSVHVTSLHPEHDIAHPYPKYRQLAQDLLSISIVSWVEGFWGVGIVLKIALLDDCNGLIIICAMSLTPKVSRVKILFPVTEIDMSQSYRSRIIAPSFP